MKKIYKPDTYKKYSIKTIHDTANDKTNTIIEIYHPERGRIKAETWTKRISKTEAVDWAKKYIDNLSQNKTTKKSSIKESVPTKTTSKETSRYVKSTLKPIIIKGCKVVVEYIKEKGKITMTNVYINSSKGKELTYIHQNRKLSKEEAEKWAKATIKERYDEWFPSDKLKNINQTIMNICGRYMSSDARSNFDGVSTYKSGNKKVFNVHFMTGDRGPRQDHGGDGGDGWMGSNELRKVSKPYFDKWNPIAKDIQVKLRKAGIVAPKVTVDYGEKGHISLEIIGNA